MNFYTAWPTVVGFSGLLAIAHTRLFSAADAPPSSRSPRLPSLDGARGLLALSVVFFHGAIYHRYLLDGRWVAPPGTYYTLLGTGGVAGFFMITGYLFWSRALAEHGRMRWAHFYVGRLFRIAPLYLVMMLWMLLTVMSASDWALRVPLLTLLRQIVPWLALGVMDPVDLNGHPATLILIAGVTWSLRYEWLFYALLPAIAVAAMRPHWALACCTVAVVGTLIAVERGALHLLAPGDPAFMTLFLMGMLAASLQANGLRLPLEDQRAEWLASTAFIVIVVTIFLTSHIAYELRTLVLLGLAFYLVSSGCSVFGLLTSRAARRLGDVSYGIYLLQGLVLASVLSVEQIRALALRGPIYHWLIVLGATVLLAVVATVVHALVERPGIALGRRVAALLPSQQRTAPV